MISDVIGWMATTNDQARRKKRKILKDLNKLYVKYGRWQDVCRIRSAPFLFVIT